MKQTKEILDILEANDSKVEKNLHKERYLEALRNIDDRLDEEAVGHSLGFSKEYTNMIIKELLSDGKIKPHSTGMCRYRPT